MVIVLAVVGFRLFPEQDVTVLHDGQSYRVSAMFQPQAEALAAADVALRPGDRVLAGSGGGTTTFAVQRARPIRIAVDGQLLERNTLATTVGGALADMGIDLHTGDRVYIGNRLTTPRGPLLSSGFVSLEAAGATSVTPLTVQVRRARPITLVTDRDSVTLPSAADTVQDFLADQGMTVRELDLVEPMLESSLPQDGVVRLKSAFSIPVWLDGKDHVLYTQAQTVADIVAVMGVTLGGDDSVEPALATRVTSSTKVVIRRTRVVEETEEEAIAPRVVEELDIALARGQSHFVDGTPGLKLKTMKVTYKNGEKVASAEVRSMVVREPVPTRRIVGGKGPAAAAAPGVSSANAPLPGRKMFVTATWYDASHGAWTRDDPNYGTTYSGIKLKKGICAVDRSVIPLYTRMWVPGYGECLAADTGSGVNGPHIDVGFDESDPDRSSWGVRDLEITILD
ncbi:MAG: ubiquitin-like domain-containing protein [Dehalococcoidia bacterium]